MDRGPKSDGLKLKEERGRARSLAYLLLMNVVMIIVLAVTGYLYTNYVDTKREHAERKARAELEQRERERDLQFCGVFGRIDKQYQATPPPTETGRVFADDIHKLVVSLNCPQE